MVKGTIQRQTNGLNDHCVHFVGAELELVAAEGVGQSKRHGLHIGRGNT